MQYRNTENEEWDRLPKKFGLSSYQVSTKGNIKVFKAEENIRPYLDANGIPHVDLVENRNINSGKKTSYMLGYLIAASFRPTQTFDIRLGYNDRNPLNVNSTNLSWCGQSALEPYVNNPDKIYYALLNIPTTEIAVDMLTLDGDLLYIFKDYKVAAKLMNLKPGAIYVDIKDYTYTGTGFKWRIYTEDRRVDRPTVNEQLSLSKGPVSKHSNGVVETYENALVASLANKNISPLVILMQCILDRQQERKFDTTWKFHNV